MNALEALWHYVNFLMQIGVDFALKVLKLNPSMEVRLQLWDIAGQERFGSMTHVYYREAVAAFVVFDIARQSTFDSLAEWKADIDAKVTYGPENKPIPVVLLANKCDLPRDTFCKTTEEIELFAKEHGFIAWFETSAKNDIGIEKAAEFLVGYILAHDASFRAEKDDHIITNDDLGKAMTANTSGVGCC